MPNTTDEFWTVNGYSLNTFSRNVQSWGGPKQGAMARQLGTVLLPRVDGALVSPGSYEARTIELSGWVLGINEAWSESGVRLFRKNWASLRNTFVSPATNGLLKIEKRVLVTDTLKPVSTTAYLSDGLEPEMTTPARATWAANLILPEVFFTRSEPAVPLVKNTWKTIEVPGDENADFMLEVTGAATDFTLEFGMLTQAVSKRLKFEGATSTLKMLTREKSIVSAGKPINGRARFTGGRFWKMPPGTRHIRYTTMTGDPTVKITPISRYW